MVDHFFIFQKNSLHLKLANFSSLKRRSIFTSRKILREKLELHSTSKKSLNIAKMVTAAFSGFAFYTGMSSLLYSAASVVGVTLPFATYMGASSTVAVLSGPVGWAIITVGAAVGAGFIGMPDYQKTAQMIIAIHLIKVDAIQKSGLKIQDYIGSDVGSVGRNKQ